MGVKIGLLVLFIMGASWTCDAREVMTTSLSSGETMISDVSGSSLNLTIFLNNLLIVTVSPHNTLLICFGLFYENVEHSDYVMSRQLSRL